MKVVVLGGDDAKIVASRILWRNGRSASRFDPRLAPLISLDVIITSISIRSTQQARLKFG